MTNLDNILGTLLLRNNCVVIPSLGGFVANYISARVDVKNGLIVPPKKALSFNKNLNTNDGLIIHHLAYEKNISFDEAKEVVHIEVQQIKDQLNKGLRVHFHNVGFLYLNNAGKIAFEQDRFFNLLLSSYGMGNIQFITENETEEVGYKKPVTSTKETPQTLPPKKEERAVEVPKEKKEIETPQRTKTIPVAKQSDEAVEVKEAERKTITVESATAQQEEAKEIEHPALVRKSSSKKLISKIIKYAAVAALFPVLFYSFWIPMKTDVLQSGVVYQEDFNPFYKTTAFNYLPEANKTHLWIDTVKSAQTLSSIITNLSSSTPVFTYPLDDDLYIPVRRKSLSNTKIKSTSQPKEIQKTPQRNKYHAIVGCFSNPRNAKKAISRLKSKGFDAYEVDVKGGLHRVSAGDGKTRAKMNTLQQRLTNKEIPSWVLKK